MNSTIIRVKKRNWFVSRLRYVFFRLINPLKAKVEKQINDMLIKNGELCLQDLRGVMSQFISHDIDIFVEAGVTLVPNIKPIPLCPTCAFYLGKMKTISTAEQKPLE